MSLLEDALHLMRAVLEYFGVPPEMLVPVWDSQLCGQYRSIVRMIGTNLPLTPMPRVHFQLPLLTGMLQGNDDITVDKPAIPTFADVLWVFEDEGDSCAKTRNYLPPKKQISVKKDALRCPKGPVNQTHRGRKPAKPKLGCEDIKKITALESELLKLQAQIAMIVTAAATSGLNVSQTLPASPAMSPGPSLSPRITSTPRATAPPPPPPPPPPLPPSFSFSTETPLVTELIQLRRKNLDKAQIKAEVSEKKGAPSMLDILKDLNQVKLKAVERSPGGTPVNRRRSKGISALQNDPAALIAEALKRKFALHRHNCSSDKENSIDLSPFGSPDVPKSTQHTRRSQGRIHL
ncbi:mitochondrial fission regulator 2 [Synchiropus splendidus]|uniref:mitochondrial fission regulator 2 n=1 Tax=Synchiropus splendidus TaxID=270530 RepID=UPI00237D9C8D|nr:mitochondrial fission regulator 2 [Synchiropus splendidus]